MRNFHRIAENLIVAPLMLEIMRQPHLWDENTLRTKTEGSPHSNVSDIWLMFNKIPDKPEDVVDDREVIPYHAWYALPSARSLVLDIMRFAGGVRLGRVVITRLPPGKDIPEHVDGGAPATYYTRYQVALKSLSGAIMAIEEETINFKTGEAWMINNTRLHGVWNGSEDDRIVMIMDIRSE